MNSIERDTGTYARHDPGFAFDTALECARGIAALWVFMFHIADMFSISSSVLFSIAKYGYQGVPLFFVISGYCMYAAAEKTIAAHHHPNIFLKRRLLRVFPPFWMSIIVIMVMPYLLEGISSFKSGKFIEPSPSWLAFSTIDWIQLLTLSKVFFSQDGDLQAAFTPINAVYWSLAIELQFYLVIYAALFFRSVWKKILAAVLCLSAFTFFLPSINNIGLFLQFWPAFFLGILLRMTHSLRITPATVFGIREKYFSLLATIVLVVGLVTVIFSAPCATPFSCSKVPNLIFIIASAFSAVLLWHLGGIEHSIRYPLTSPDKTILSRHWMILPLCWLGQSSYSLYLLHGKVHQLPAMFVRQMIAPENIAYPAITIIATIIICFGFYKLVEVPFQHGGRMRTNSNMDSVKVLPVST
jgi:peptidoglycan/LPS O-acetylase OafA/YrhL